MARVTRNVTVFEENYTHCRAIVRIFFRLDTVTMVLRILDYLNPHLIYICIHFFLVRISQFTCWTVIQMVKTRSQKICILFSLRRSHVSLFIAPKFKKKTKEQVPLLFIIIIVYYYNITKYACSHHTSLILT